MEQFAGLVPVPAPLMIVGMNEVRKKIAESLGAGVPPEVMEMLLTFGLMLRAKTNAIDVLLMARRQWGIQAELEPGINEIRRLIAEGILSTDDVPELCFGTEAPMLLVSQVGLVGGPVIP